MIAGLRTSLADMKARVGLQRQLGLASTDKLDAADALITTLEREIQALEDIAAGREFPTLPKHEKRAGREITRRIGNHAAELDELLA